MFKKTLTAIFTIVAVVFLWIANSTPLFKNYASQFEVYQKSNSSTAQITLLNGVDLWLTTQRYGEACVINNSIFDLDDFLKEFNAKTVMTEQSLIGTNYYAYSPKIKYCKTINGYRVNLHVFIGEDNVKVGSPLIYGSY